MAFDTKYDVSTQVDSSAPADRLPAICGSATFAIEVSSTSMNVARVTVTAITQGLIVPSGFLSLARILFPMAFEFRLFCFLPATAPTYDRLAPLLYSRRLVRDDRCVHIHSRPQHSFLRWNRI